MVVPRWLVRLKGRFLTAELSQSSAKLSANDWLADKKTDRSADKMSEKDLQSKIQITIISVSN